MGQDRCRDRRLASRSGVQRRRGWKIGCYLITLDRKQGFQVLWSSWKDLDESFRSNLGYPRGAPLRGCESDWSNRTEESRAEQGGAGRFRTFLMHWEQTVRYAILSDLGMRRQNNEDAATVRVSTDITAYRRNGHLFVVADGMGGHAVGELASRIATEALPLNYMKSRLSCPGEALQEAIAAANSAIHEKGEANRDFSRMGTTCTALVLSEEGAYIGHVGDSRCYRVRRDRIDQLTFDHSLQWELIRRGGMDPDEVLRKEPRNIITRSLGPEESVQIDIEGPFAILPHDTYILCSDGLTNHVSDEEIGIIASHLHAPEAARLLVHLTNARGGTDNVTVLVVQVGPLPASYADPPPPDPTEPPSPLWLVLAWIIAIIFLLGLILGFTGHYVEAVFTAGISRVALAATLFRVWQIWYRQPRERTLYGDERAHWQPYRTASTELTDTFLKTLVRIDSDLHRAAHEEGWPFKAKIHDRHVEELRLAMGKGDRQAALHAAAKSIHVLMRGLNRYRRDERDPLLDLIAKPKE